MGTQVLENIDRKPQFIQVTTHEIPFGHASPPVTCPKPRHICQLKQSFNVLSTQTHPTRITRLNLMSFNSGDLERLYEALWNSFCSDYCVTSAYWPTGMTQLASHYEVLDLALMALSAKRLSFNGHPQLKLVSHEAYGRSLQLFRRQLGQGLREKHGALYATVSLIFTLFEVSSFGLDVLFQEKNNAFEHLEGAMAFLKTCKPDVFDAAGFFEAFLKIRELVV